MPVKTNVLGEAPSREDLPTLLLFALLLAGSLMRGLREPLLGKSISNLLPMLWAWAILLVQYRGFAAASRTARGLVWLTLIALLWCALCSVVSPHRLSAILQTGKYLSYALVFWAVFSIPRRCQAACRRILLGFLLLLAALGVAELFGPAAPWWGLLRGEITRSMQPRISSTFLWPNQFGLAMVIACLWLGVLGSERETRQARGIRPMLWIALPVLLWCVGQTGSRNAWVCLLFGPLLLALARRMSWRMLIALWAGFLLVVAAFPVPYLQSGLPPNRVFPLVKGIQAPAGQGQKATWKNLAAVNNLSQASDSLRDRWLLAERAWQDMLDNPLCGLGPRGFSESSGKEIMHEAGFHPHNILLTVGSEAGFPGLLLFLLFLAGLARISWKRTNLMILLGFIMLAGQMLDCFLFDNLFCLIWAIVTALGLKAADETPA